ncbi:MAG: M23 family metallopeptidase [Oscillospiraceae bacterium]|nr:M23 family metallopeptidase [Oscillospiraceae bacterium]
MKKKLFGSLGQSIRTNWVIVLLSLCVVGAGALSFYTVSDINEKLKNQQLPDPDMVVQENTEQQPPQQQQAEEVQKPQQNVPLKPSAPPQNAEAAAQSAPQPSASPEAEKESRKDFVLPVDGKIVAAFSGNELVYNKTMDDWRTHNGIDIKAPAGTAVQACCDGTVTAVYQDGMLGCVVETDNGSYTVRYCGLDSGVSVQKGDRIKQKQPIGKVGEIPLEMAADSHIHLEIIKDGQYKNPDSYLE